MNAADGKVSALYEYGPFGELLRATGPMAKANPFRFSTKYQDDETGFLYYGFRFYRADLGRWLNQDPIGEAGGLNLYGFLNGNPIGSVDLLGLVDEAALCELNYGQRMLRESNQPHRLYPEMPWLDKGEYYMGQALAAVNNVGRLPGPLGDMQDTLGGLWGSFRSWVSESATEVSQGLYDLMMGEQSGPYNQTTLGALNAQYGVVDIDRDNNVLRDSFGAFGQLFTDSAVTAGELYFMKKAGDVIFSGSTRCPCRSTASGRTIDALEGRLGGGIVEDAKLDRLEKILAKNDTMLERNADVYLDSRNAAALFEGAKPGTGSSTLYVRSGATQFELYHELKHWGDFNRLGFDAYTAMGQLWREESVFNYLKNQAWMTKNELDAAYEYLKVIRRRHGEL